MILLAAAGWLGREVAGEPKTKGERLKRNMHPCFPYLLLMPPNTTTFVSKERAVASRSVHSSKGEASRWWEWHV
ncbi:hypothetical protein LMH87_009507 [Akanthomyces muscarius]|uniref:Uncharacterized protein n=1 Tax=Akanthomyces muscarius TaxID=2231603 RepID=A0A9W8QDM6_AKAMU|nr:hypothetical protein LMH87_009507 [Akanthomyces muscarius]KAJ4152993.1 hypothetical protein LMH87_009507 [Akanthomyces muscarius]